MNNIRAIETLNQRELEAGIPLSASWHTDWADTAYVYIGGLPYELSEGDIIAIFSQFGEPVHVNLIRDKDTGKSKGFAFLKYEDQRSTSLAVDNLGGATILGRIIRVDHTRYKPKESEVIDENAHQDSSTRAGDEDGDDGGAGHRKRRRRRNDDFENDDKRKKRTPPREMLKEELELQKLVREHDEEDPMKGYLIRQKKDDVEKALEKLKKEKKKVSKHGHESSRSEHRHRSRRHRSQSRESSRRYRSRSKDRQQAMKSLEEIDHARDEAREVRRQRTDDTNRIRDKDTRRGDHNKERGGNGGSRNERMRRGQFKGREQEIEKEWDVDNEKGKGYYKDPGRTDISRRMKHKDM